MRNSSRSLTRDSYLRRILVRQHLVNILRFTPVLSQDVTIPKSIGGLSYRTPPGTARTAIAATEEPGCSIHVDVQMQESLFDLRAMHWNTFFRIPARQDSKKAAPHPLRSQLW